MNLPDELLWIIAQYLALTDRKSFALTSKRGSRLMEPHIYQSIQCQWSSLPEFCNLPFARHVHTLRLRGPGEWKFSPFLLKASTEWPHLRELDMSMLSSSSAWLKYVRPLDIKVLQLECDFGGTRYFDFDHLVGLELLEQVVLTNFCIVTPELPHPTLGALELRDCTWDYPSDLAEIGPLRSLKVHLSRFHPFAFSERLQFTANNPPPEVEELVLHLELANRVSWKPLRNGSKSIKFLSLKGFERIKPTQLPQLVSIDQG